jgi:hypothetical protein
MTWLSKLLGAHKLTRRSACRQQYRPGLETLENRTLLSANPHPGFVLLPSPPIVAYNQGAVLELFSNSTTTPSGETLDQSGPPAITLAVKSFSFEVQGSSPTDVGAGVGSGKSVITNVLDVMTRDLFLPSDSQSHFSEAILQFPNRVGAEWIFTNMDVTSEQLSGHVGGLSEQLEFQFGRVGEHFEQAVEPFVRTPPKGQTIAASTPFSLEQVATTASPTPESQPTTAGQTIPIAAFSFSTVDPITIGAGNGGTLNFTTTSPVDAGTVVRDIEQAVHFQLVILHVQPKDAQARDDFSFGAVRPESVRVAGDANSFSVDVAYSYAEVNQSEHQVSTTTNQRPVPGGSGLDLAVSGIGTNDTVTGETLGTVGVRELAVSSFSLDLPQSAGGQTIGGGSGKSVGSLDVALVGLPVDARELRLPTRLALIQRVAGGRTISELDFAAARLTSAVVIGANGAVSEDLQFSFGAVTATTVSPTPAKTPKDTPAPAEEKAALAAKLATEKKAEDAKKLAEEVTKKKANAVETPTTRKKTAAARAEAKATAKYMPRPVRRAVAGLGAHF